VVGLVGQFELLKWLHSEGCLWDEYTCSYALLGGHIKICDHTALNTALLAPKPSLEDIFF
jgi:hypothetical protein